MRQNKDMSIEQALKDAGLFDELGKYKVGPTMYGVSLYDLQYWRENLTLEVKDLQALTKSEAFKYYEKTYWETTKATYLPAGIDYMVFDLSILCNVTNVIRWLQIASGEHPSGLWTIEALNRINSPHIDLPGTIAGLELMARRRLRNHPQYKVYGQTWTNRITTARIRSLKLLKK